MRDLIGRLRHPRRNARMLRAVILIAAAVALLVAWHRAPEPRPAATSAPASAASSPATPAAAMSSRVFQRRTEAGMERLLYLMSRHSGPQPRRYADGIWHGDPGCWRCAVAPAVPAAVLARLRDGRSRWLPIAERTLDVMLKRHARADGSLGPALGPEHNAQISTMTAGNYLATSYLELEPYLSAERRARWRDAVAAAAAWLRPHLDFYVNGNVNLGQTVFFYLAWRVTGQRALYDEYRRALQFTLAPTGRWRGFGLHYFTRPHRADGSDGSGYLAEGFTAGTAGYDTNYTMVQDDWAALLFAYSRSAESRRLLNLLTNTLVRRADKHRWLIPSNNGSRHPGQHSVVQYQSAALPVAAYAAGRDDLRPLVPNQLAQSLLAFRALLVQGPGHEDTVSKYATALIALQRRR